MGICWHCAWGWANEVADLYESIDPTGFYEGVLHFGPSHIVWDDENFDDESIDFCLSECGKP